MSIAYLVAVGLANKVAEGFRHLVDTDIRVLGDVYWPISHFSPLGFHIVSNLFLESLMENGKDGAEGFLFFSGVHMRGGERVMNQRLGVMSIAYLGKADMRDWDHADGRQVVRNESHHGGSLGGLGLSLLRGSTRL